MLYFTKYAEQKFDILNKYKDFLHRCESDLITSYRKVFGNLVSLCGLEKRFSMHSLLDDIAKGELPLSINPDVRLAVFGYDRDQGNGKIWEPHCDKLKAGTLLLMKGDPNGFSTGISSPDR